MNVRRWLTAVAVFVTAAVGSLTLGVPTAQAATCDGVWVVVAGQGTRCATSHGTGKAALQSAGFSTKDKSPGFLCQIGGSPKKCVITTDAYWSYWQATKNSDGSWGKWTYSNLGYTSTRPKRGSAEGWTFGNGKTPPPAPPKAAKPPPAPEPTKPAPAPSTTAPKPPATKPAAAKPAASATKDPAPGKTSTKPVAPTASQQPAEPEASETPTEEATPTQPSVTQTQRAEPADSGSPSPAAAPTMTPTSATAAGGSPVDTVATLAVVVLGGGGLGTWWFLKRRP